MNDQSEAYYGGFEPVEVGNLEEVREIRTVIPATRNVRMKIRKVENRVNQDNTYRSLNLQLQLVNGIDAEGKYKNKVVFSRVCYYADPTIYTKEFFKTRQHLVQLKYLLKATGLQGEKIDGYIIEKLEHAPEISGDITITTNWRDEEGRRVDRRIMAEMTTYEREMLIQEQDNEARGFKALSTEELV